MTRRIDPGPASKKRVQRETRLEKQTKLGWVGWREWISLPDLGLPFIEAKIDSGARSSSLDAQVIEEFRRKRERWVRFVIFSDIDLSLAGKVVEAKLIDHRNVRCSNGVVTERPVIETKIGLGTATWPIELTLTNRRSMGFRMLLGRTAIANRYLVNVAESYMGGAFQSE
jgi:hypothetical protein